MHSQNNIKNLYVQLKDQNINVTLIYWYWNTFSRIYILKLHSDTCLKSFTSGSNAYQNAVPFSFSSFLPAELAILDQNCISSSGLIISGTPKIMTLHINIKTLYTEQFSATAKIQSACIYWNTDSSSPHMA